MLYKYLFRGDSFVFGIFNGDVNPQNIFPYPKVFDQEGVDETNQMYEQSRAGEGKHLCVCSEHGRTRATVDPCFDFSA